MRAKNQKGFSLLEVLLAVTIAIALGSMQLGQIKRESETMQAKAVGDQLNMVGRALNSYVTLQYHNLITGTDVLPPGTSEDPGPRDCGPAVDPVTGENIIRCTIDSDTLRRSGLLPNNFSGRNAFGATYQYFIRVSGNAPNWKVDGMVTTSDPYTVGSIPRFDLIGQAMVVAGADSGTTRSLADQVEGLNGSWSDKSFPLTQVGLLAYRVGYGTSGYSSYMRIDGSTNMTGGLNLGNPADPATFHNLGATRNIAATGTVQGGKFYATSPTGDAITTTAGTIGANGSTMVIRTGALQVLDQAGTGLADIEAGDISGGNIQAGGAGNFAGATEARSFNTTSLGISSFADIQATSAITAGGNISTQNGNIFTTNGNISATNGSITSNTLSAGNSNFASNRWTMGTNTADTGGWFMNDTNWIQSVGGKGIKTTGTIQGQILESDGNMIVGSSGTGTLDLTGTPQVRGTACGPAGSIARSASGVVLQCVQPSSGTPVWEAINATTSRVTSTASCSGGAVCFAQCPPGTKVVGGGFRLTYRPTTDDPYTPKASYPDKAANRWMVESVTGYSSTFLAEAVCAG